MGVSISTHSSLAPISLASTVIGFVSFAVTVATLLRVSWENLETIGAAPTEIPDVLGNLKAGLYEERRHMRRVIRWQRRRRRTQSEQRGRGEKGDPYRTTREDEIGDRTTLVLNETIKHMLQKFRDLERPFLRDDAHERRRRARRGDLEHEDWDTDGMAWVDPEAREASYLQNEYRHCGFKQRWQWLTRKSACVNLALLLSRVQTRRIAHETGNISLAIQHMERDWRHLDDRMWALENRLSRVVGVRRVE